MSFWDLSDNSNAKDTGSSFESSSNMEPIPAGTGVLAAPDEAAWAEYQGDEYISIRWVVLAPDEYKNRKVFQKIRVFESDAKKRDKAKRMLAAIDANAGGKLTASGERPTDESLARCLVNKPMQLRLEVWESDGKSGNWVAAVAPKTAPSAQPGSAAQSKKEDDVPW